ncbi:MAG: phosphate acyltransferase, partial [Cyclobacteriaceae bacterium]
MTLLDKIRANARTYQKRIILPESYEERTLKAANTALEEGLAQIILLGNKEKILSQASDLKLGFLDKATI